MIDEILKYFAHKNMESCLLNTVYVVWEELGEIEKQMVKSFKELNMGICLIYSRTLFQSELENELARTPHITFLKNIEHPKRS